MDWSEPTPKAFFVFLYPAPVFLALFSLKGFDCSPLKWRGDDNGYVTAMGRNSGTETEGVGSRKGLRKHKL